MRLDHFLNSLIQYANFFEIRQKNANYPPIAFFLLYILWILKKLAYCVWGIKKMVKSQTARSINKLVASMSSLMLCFAAIAESIKEKTKMDITRPP